MFFILLSVNLEEGEIVNITSPNFPNDYPRGQREVWRLLSTTGYVLNFTHFSLEYSYDFLHIRNRNTATRMDTTKVLTGEFTNKAYIFEGPYIELTFTSDEIIHLSGFRVEISAPNISSLGKILQNIFYYSHFLINLTNHV